MLSASGSWESGDDAATMLFLHARSRAPWYFVPSDVHPSTYLEALGPVVEFEEKTLLDLFGDETVEPSQSAALARAAFDAANRLGIRVHHADL